MPSQAGEVFDIPQNYPRVLPVFYQDVRGYDDQQIMVLPRKARFATGVSSGAYVLSYFYDHPQPNKDFTEQLRVLHQHYTILADDRTVIELVGTEPAIYSLLSDAVEALRHAFGEQRIIYVRVQSSDEDNLLKVAVQLPADFGDGPERTL